MKGKRRRYGIISCELYLRGFVRPNLDRIGLSRAGNQHLKPRKRRRCAEHQSDGQYRFLHFALHG